MIRKQCSKCKETKPLEQFSRRTNSVDGRMGHCKECASKYHQEDRKKHPGRQSKYNRRTRLGIEPEDFDRILREQGGKCAICRKPLIGESKNSAPHLDHDHVFGYHRGILCHGCNAGIGQMHDDPEIVLAAYNYLVDWQV